jgi:hypothetical protein
MFYYRADQGLVRSPQLTRMLPTGGFQAALVAIPSAYDIQQGTIGSLDGAIYEDADPNPGINPPNSSGAAVAAARKNAKVSEPGLRTIFMANHR